MSKENEKAIPTLEEYIAEQIATKRAAALNKSRTRNLPAYPLKNEIMTEQEWNDSLVKREQSTRNSVLPQSIKALNIVGIDSERRAGYANYVGSNCIGPTCAKTAADNYGVDFIGSQLFRDNHANYGFKKVDNKSVKPGDIVIDVENGKGSHTMMLDSNGKEGLRFNHSNGGFGPENIRKNARYPFKGSMESYTYTGTPADSALWINQYKQIYGMAKGGIFGISYLKKGKRIHIKKKNRGKFTEYCGGKVTDECILKAKKSKNPKLRKRATFALNSRSWSKKHEEGAKIHKPYGHKSILDNGWQSTKELKKKRPLIAINANGGLVSEGTKKPIDKKSLLTNEPKKKLVVKRLVNPTGMVNKRPIPGLLTNELVALNTKKSETKK